jgi:hypothetical protein
MSYVHIWPPREMRLLWVSLRKELKIWREPLTNTSSVQYLSSGCDQITNVRYFHRYRYASSLQESMLEQSGIRPYRKRRWCRRKSESYAKCYLQVATRLETKVTLVGRLKAGCSRSWRSAMVDEQGRRAFWSNIVPLSPPRTGCWRRWKTHGFTALRNADMRWS